MASGAGERRNATLACLDAMRDQPLSHDNLFHTVLGMTCITAAEYRPPLDITAACRTVAERSTKTAMNAAPDSTPRQ